MTVHKKTTDDNNQNPAKQGLNPESAAVLPGKEQAPQTAHNEEEKLLKEVVERRAQADRELVRKAQEDIQQEIKVSRPEIDLPEDLKEHGVKAPQTDASQIVINGSDAQLPISESGLETGSISDVGGKRTRTKTIYGVPSVLAMALWAKRVILVLHKHAKNVVFRKDKLNAGTK